MRPLHFSRAFRSKTKRATIRPPRASRKKLGEWCLQTLKQACSQEYPGSAMCVQRFDDSVNSAIRITYRISLRSSSLWEPRYPPFKVVIKICCFWYSRRTASERLGKKKCKCLSVDNLKVFVKKQNSFTKVRYRYWIGVVMILPQVHLRKPCYDFTFL